MVRDAVGGTCRGLASGTNGARRRWDEGDGRKGRGGTRLRILAAQATDPGGMRQRRRRARGLVAPWSSFKELLFLVARWQGRKLLQGRCSGELLGCTRESRSGERELREEGVGCRVYPEAPVVRGRGRARFKWRHWLLREEAMLELQDGALALLGCMVASG